ncbi:YozE family protein [Caldibacillus lycopersici]|uniref:UPF0346 protein OEV98_08600 n=1 Tax=Perspicuibacillus lycopersici TaxID=1325689 RepID=A0AAE3LT82_9BACI|nr:YozE family protein [Perspicuibacillus lycopersici]MCU9613618.1 YozE family protein [Perspicuibacillus lycopersici]
MAKTFYHFLMTYRNPQGKDDISHFANHAYHDHSFPTRSSDYDEVSRYLELNGDYLSSMTVFDNAWELYVQIEKPFS